MFSGVWLIRFGTWYLVLVLGLGLFEMGRKMVRLETWKTGNYREMVFIVCVSDEYSLLFRTFFLSFCRSLGSSTFGFVKIMLLFVPVFEFVFLILSGLDCAQVAQM